ncbi:MAG: hypothetical protein O3A51_10030, partial [Verrucomicrobia bacterium]|nr:hypothetical protein [Verrucomicrobiota bacterium]
MKLRSLFSRPPVDTRHYKRTLLFSADDDVVRPSRMLIEFALAAVRRTLDVDLRAVSDRMPASEGRWPDVWPGEHYQLLAAIVAELQPQTVVEVGTFTGLSSLSMLTTLPPGSRLITYDLIPWRDFSDSCLQAS